MNKRLILIFMLAWLMVCHNSLAKPDTIPPASDRSLKVIQKVRPKIQIELKRAGLTWGAPIFIRIFKAEKTLEIWLKKGKTFQLFKSYPVCTYGFAGLGPKIRQGDGRAPEGFYYIAPRFMNPYSRYHLSFNLGYPNTFDRAYNRTGSALMVHGSCVSIGCYAMTDKRMEEIYALSDAALRNGQPFFRVHIFPFKMTRINMLRHRQSTWYPFWQNLRQGYDWFEKHKVPPDVNVQGRQYVFSDA